MNINTVFEDFLLEFPELSKNVIDHMKEYHIDNDEGIYFRFPCIMRCVRPLLEDVESLEKNEDLVIRIFDFIERMATCSDDDVVNLMTIEVTKALATVTN